MAIQLISSAHAGSLHGIKCLVYGKAGMGKTTLLATAPNVVILSAESGLLSLRNVHLPVIQITSLAILSEAFQWLQQSAEAKQFQTIGIDSLSEIGEMVLSNAKAQVKDPRQAYGELIEKMMTTVKAYRNIVGKHVVMTAKEETFKDAVGVTSNGPMMPGNRVSQELPYLFDEVFRLGVNKTPQNVEYRYLQTQPDMQSTAKDRSGALDPIEQPNLTHIFNKILGVA